MRQLFALLVVTTVVLACSNPAAPSGALVGTWGGLLTELRATPEHADVQLRCLTARMPPIAPDANSEFALEGTVRSASWTGGIGLPFRISGTVRTGTIELQHQIKGTAEWSEPTVVTLKADTVGDYTSVGGGCIV
jgi:hypothetical protein